VSSFVPESPVTPGPHHVTLKKNEEAGEWVLSIENLLVADTAVRLGIETQRNNTVRIGGVGYIYGKGIMVAVPDDRFVPLIEMEFSGATVAEQADRLAELIEENKVASGLSEYDVVYLKGDEFITFKPRTADAPDPWFLYSEYQPGVGFYQKGRPWKGWANPAFERMGTDEPWFEVYRLPGNVFALNEPAHDQEVTSYLVIGDDGLSALLYDTGYAMGNIVRCVESILKTEGYDIKTDEIIVVTSHTGNDHHGGNQHFKDIRFYNCEEPGFAYSNEEADSYIGPPALSAEMRLRTQDTRVTLGVGGYWGVWWNISQHMTFNDDQSLCDYVVRGTDVSKQGATLTFLADGEVVNVGGRELLVAHTPGHETNRSDICLIDKAAGFILTGDIYYTAAMYANNMWDSVWLYKDSMEYLERLCQEHCIKWIYPAHNFPVEKSGIFESVFGDLAVICDHILNGKVDAHPKYLEYRDNASGNQRVFYFGNPDATADDDYYSSKEWLLFRVNPRQFTGFDVPKTLAEVKAAMK